MDQGHIRRGTRSAAVLVAEAPVPADKAIDLKRRNVRFWPEVAGENRVVMFAGQRYREFLVEPLRKRGIKVEVPMANLARGEQLASLSNHQ